MSHNLIPARLRQVRYESDCANCGKLIMKSTVGDWTHVENNSTWCPGSTRAVPGPEVRLRGR